MRSARKPRQKKTTGTEFYRYLERDCDRRWMYGVKALVDYRSYLVRTIRQEMTLLALMDRTDGWKIKKYEKLLKGAMGKKALADLAAAQIAREMPSTGVTA